MKKPLPTGMIQTQARVVQHRVVAADHYQMTLLAPRVAKRARPGQFVHLLCTPVTVGKRELSYPFLRRPISLLDVHPTKGTIELLYKVVGLGTRALAQIPPNSKVDLLGPLGQSFEVPPQLRKAYLVGGGVGIPPMVFLGRALQAKGVSTEVFLGARTKSWIICVKDFERLGVVLHIATNDGTCGYRGSVVELLGTVIARERRDRSNLKTRLPRRPAHGGTPRNDGSSTVVYICGPTPMMAAATKLAQSWKLPTQVSLEERMGCAMGCCWGCVVEVVNEPITAHARFQRVCTEGPVFAGEEIRW